MAAKEPAFSPQALKDLEEIGSFISQRTSVEIALRLVDELRASMNRLAEMPGMGRKREEFTSDESLSFWVAHKHYLVVYHADSDPIEIVRVLHTSRYIPSIFDED